MIATTSKLELKRELEAHRAIPLVAFQIVKIRGINIYCRREENGEQVLVCSPTQEIGEEQFAEVKSNGFESLLVRVQDFPQVSKKLHGSIDSVLGNTAIPLETRFALLQIAYASEIERLFRKAYISKYIALVQELGRKISALVQQGEMSILVLCQSIHHTPSPYARLTNVAAYACLLAQSLEIASPEELDDIAIGALLHEVGKLYLPDQLLSKKGRLSVHNRQDLEHVPQLAYEALCEHEDIKFGQLMMAYQQNERIDGTGYPVRTIGDDIHPWARLIAVVNVFDAITSERENRPALSLRKALLHLADGAKTHFDPEMVLCWITNSQPQ